MDDGAADEHRHVTDLELGHHDLAVRLYGSRADLELVAIFLGGRTSPLLSVG